MGVLGGWDRVFGWMRVFWLGGLRWLDGKGEGGDFGMIGVGLWWKLNTNQSTTKIQKPPISHNTQNDISILPQKNPPFYPTTPKESPKNSTHPNKPSPQNKTPILQASSIQNPQKIPPKPPKIPPNPKRFHQTPKNSTKPQKIPPNPPKIPPNPKKFHQNPQKSHQTPQKSHQTPKDSTKPPKIPPNPPKIPPNPKRFHQTPKNSTKPPSPYLRSPTKSHSWLARGQWQTRQEREGRSTSSYNPIKPRNTSGNSFCTFGGHFRGLFEVWRVFGGLGFGVLGVYGGLFGFFLGIVGSF